MESTIHVKRVLVRCTKYFPAYCILLHKDSNFTCFIMVTLIHGLCSRFCSGVQGYTFLLFFFFPFFFPFSIILTTILLVGIFKKTF